MPESPEVQLIIDNINKHITSTTKLKQMEVISGRYKKHGLPKNFKQINNQLPLKLDKLQKKGKFIYFKLKTNSKIKDDIYVMFTMGMTGHLMWSDDHNDFFEMRDKYRRIKFETTSGDFYFVDMRNFGTLSFCETMSCINAKLSNIGTDILSSQFNKINLVEFKKHLNEKSNETDKIGDILVNQNIYSGIGNYLRSEVLYNAKLNPFKKLIHLNNNDYKNLLNAMKKVPKKFYLMQKNSELHDYIFNVYKQKVDLYGNKVKAKKLKDGRNVYYVSKLQK